MKAQPYPEYKPSGVEWLGEVPKHWDVDRLKWSTTGCINGTWGDDPTGENEIVCIRVADFNRENFNVADSPPTIRSVEPNQRKTRKLHKSDLLIEKSGGGDKQLVGFVVSFEHEFEAVCSNFVARMPVQPSFPSRFWCYVHAAIYAGRLNYPAIKQTTGIQNLDSSFYLNNRAPYPPPDEQTAIAAYLDRETGRIDELVAKKRELIERLKEKRTALIFRTVTQGLPADLPAETIAKLEEVAGAKLALGAKQKSSEIEWMGDIPEHWEVKKLSWLFRYAKGSKAAMLTKEYVAENSGEFPVFSGQTSNNGLMGMIDWHEFQFSSSVIFITTVGARAMTTRLASGKFSLSQNCALIIPRKNAFNSAYYEGVLSKLLDYERRSISLIMQPSLRFEDLDRFRVPLPPPSEQIAIATYLEGETSKFDKLVRHVATAIERLEEYRTALITAAVTGKINVREGVEA